MIKSQPFAGARNYRHAFALCIAALIACPEANAQQPAATNAIIPLIVMEDVPLTDAIKNLARQAGINYILDPRISGSGPTVNGRWENRTAEQLLTTVLQDHKLVKIENAATSVARIAPQNQGVMPVPAGRVITNADKILPVILVDDVKLNDAIRNIAAQANLKVTLDPRITSSDGRDKALPAVSFRWENISARQALAALLDNYDLVMIEDPGTAAARIAIKEQSAK
jgi:type II secretory pathway component GspD/PulD (secretin)